MNSKTPLYKTTRGGKEPESKKTPSSGSNPRKVPGSGYIFFSTQPFESCKLINII